MIAQKVFIVAFLVFVSLNAVSAMAAVVAYTDRTAWANAILAVDAGASFAKETFNGEAVSYIPGTNNGIDEGPHSYGGGAFSLSLTNIGDAAASTEFGGSQSGVINPGEFDGSNSLELRLVVDSADFELFGFFLDGEGIEQADISFTSSVLGFAGEWSDTNNQDDGVDFTINGMLFNTLAFLPHTDLNNGDGFLGFVDATGIATFSMVVGDNPMDASESTFEQIEVDEFEWAHAASQPIASRNRDSRAHHARHLVPARHARLELLPATETPGVLSPADSQRVLSLVACRSCGRGEAGALPGNRRLSIIVRAGFAARRA